MTPPPCRALTIGNPELVKVYLKHMHQYYKDHDMITRINRLHREHLNLTKDATRRLLTQWDNDQGRAMKHAEKVLQTPPKKYVWSPQLRNTAVIRQYWRLRLRELNFEEDHLFTFTRWESK